MSVHMDVCMISFAQISNHHSHMCVMEMIWGHSLILESLDKQIYRHASCPTIRRPFEPNLNVLAITLT